MKPAFFSKANVSRFTFVINFDSAFSSNKTEVHFLKYTFSKTKVSRFTFVITFEPALSLRQKEIVDSRKHFLVKQKSTGSLL